jgi:RHS repeat-associated protein
MSKKSKRKPNMQRRTSQKQQAQVQVHAQSSGGGGGGTQNTTYYVHGPRGIHSQQKNGEWKWMAEDGLGSVRSVVDDTAAVHQSIVYDPFGNPIDVAGPEQTMFGYTGEPTDLNGLVYLRNRYYSPQLGTFISQDPTEGSMKDPMSLNQYAYVQGNPVNHTDPSGLSPVNVSGMNHLMQNNPLAFAHMMNAGACNFQQQVCSNPPFCTNTPQPTRTPTGTPSPTPTLNPCAPTPTMTLTPSGTPGTPFPTVTPIPFNTARIQGLSNADLELLAINIFYEARDYPEHWTAIANVWFNRLADPYATTTNVQRLLVDNSSRWDEFVRLFTRPDATQLDPLNLTPSDVGIIADRFGTYASSTLRPDTTAARNGYPNPEYQGMLTFFHADAGRPAALRVCEMECVAAAPGATVAANLSRRGPLRIKTVAEGSRTLIMNNGIFWPSAGAGPNSFCGTCCERNVTS